MDLIILANFSQIRQIMISLVDLMILTNFGHFHSCMHFSGQSTVHALLLYPPCFSHFMRNEQKDLAEKKSS